MLPNRGVFLLSAAGALAGTLVPETARGANEKALVTANAALKNLIDGNLRFSQGRPRSRADIERVRALAAGQQPFATVLGCSDSRVPVETVFDHDPGDIFTVRVAGNFVGEAALGSIEYATAELKAPLIVVLGHSKCGAAAAAIEFVKTGKPFPGHIQHLAEAIVPAAQAVRHAPGDWLHNTIVENVRMNVRRLQTSTPILAAAVQARSVEVTGMVYDLATGRATPV